MPEYTVAKNSFFLTSSYVAQKLLSFVYFLLVAKILSVEDLGKYTFALGFTTLFAVFVDVGLNQLLVREAARDREQAGRLLTAALTAKIFLGLIVYAAVAVMVNLLGYPEVTRHLVYLSGILMLMDSFALNFWGIFRGYRDLRFEAWSVVANQAIILLVGLPIIFLKLPLLYYMAPFLSASLFSMSFGAWAVKKKLGVRFSWSIDWPEIKRILWLAAPFALLAIFSRVYGYIDTVFLSKMQGDEAVAFYNVAMKIPFALQFIPAAIGAAVYPAFSYEFAHNRDQLKLTFERVMKFLIVAVLPISAGVMVLAGDIIEFFYKPEYLPSVLPLQILMAGLFFVFLNFPLGALLNGCEKQVLNTKLVGVTMVINICLNLLLIPRFSFVGAAIAFCASHGFLFAMGWLFSGRLVGLFRKNLAITIIKAGISALAMLVVLAVLVGKLHFLILIAMGAIIYFAMLWLTRIFSAEEVTYWKNKLRRSQPPESDL